MRQILIFCSLLVFPAVIRAEKTQKVACVGNSITYGAGIAGRENNSYPAQLQQLPGEGYRVENFGHNGATAASWGIILTRTCPNLNGRRSLHPTSYS